MNEVNTDEAMALMKKLDKFEKTFMSMSDDVTKLININDAQQGLIQHLTEQLDKQETRYAFILSWIADQRDEK